MTSLQARDLKFGFDSRLIIDGIEIELVSGEVVALVGANGAGKTTLLQLLSRHLNPGSGMVSFDENNIVEWSRRTLSQRIALMPQFENRDSSLRVIDVVSLGRMPHCGWWLPMSLVDHQRVGEAIQAAGLDALRERKIDALSGGEWRRMILARSLAQDASVLLLDEPIAGLDLKYQVEVLDHVRRMTKQKNLVTVITLHDLNMAASFADRIAVLHQGRLIADGPTVDVLQPELIELAFGIAVEVIKHPTNGTPLVILCSNPRSAFAR
jgi:iron complex transport system ATP-binding protein